MRGGNTTRLGLTLDVCNRLSKVTKIKVTGTYLDSLLQTSNSPRRIGLLTLATKISRVQKYSHPKKFARRARGAVGIQQQQQPISFNSKILVNVNVIAWKSASNLFVQSFYDENGQILDWSGFKQKHEKNDTFFLSGDKFWTLFQESGRES